MSSEIKLWPITDGVTLNGRHFPIHGEVARGWEGVVDAFRSNFLSGEEIGASACVWHEGRKRSTFGAATVKKHARRPGRAIRWSTACRRRSP